MSLFFIRFMVICAIVGGSSATYAGDPSPYDKQQEAISLMRVRGHDLRMWESITGVYCELELFDPGPEELTAVANLPRLVELEIHGGKLTRASVRQMGKLSHLTRLSLDDCQFPEGNLAFLKHLTSLERLYFQCCKFEGASLSELGSLDRLYYVRISDCVLEDSGNLVFPAEMQRLSRLYVYDTFVNQWSFQQLVGSSYLTSIKFQDAKITDEYLRHAAPGENLERLRVYHQITHAAGERFKQKFPEVRFYY
ncbi:hypothetical protein Pan97_51700 [Bremerella volcania]|uniref:Leucine Rich repeats (2 copies) n=1 Tax=Bremerella volcania TaxID=2527984 RepID=A0A518CFT0_9BACT|nr:hypothetical protein [Bremerella volcania]QDU78090.1 hypothetical protein Pan97_51700 [Bremerella volcania]